LSIERAHTQSYAAGSGCLNLNRILGGLALSICLPLNRLLSDAFRPTHDVPPVLTAVIRVSVVGNNRTNSPNVDTLRMAKLKPGFVRRNLEASAVVILRPSSCNLATSASAWGCRLCFFAASILALPPSGKLHGFCGLACCWYRQEQFTQMNLPFFVFRNVTYL
jgi:hypothetical protein